jgi:hypothetical protein
MVDFAKRGFALVTVARRLEVEQATVERQRLIDITDLKSDMVETDGARFLFLGHSCLRSTCPPPVPSLDVLEFGVT